MMSIDAAERKRARDRAYYYAHREKKLAYQRTYNKHHKVKTCASYERLKMSDTEWDALTVMEQSSKVLRGMLTMLRFRGIAAGVYDVVCRMDAVCAEIREHNGIKQTGEPPARRTAIKVIEE